MFKRILLATDGSAVSAHAIALAVGLARVCAARLTAVYVVDPYPFMGVGETNPAGFQAYMAAAQREAERAHASVTAACGQGGPALDVQLRRIEEMNPAAGILRAAEDEGADLIVVGSHGRAGLNRLVLGSVAAKVVAQSPVPVLVAR